jgi:hypothetical protein
VTVESLFANAPLPRAAVVGLFGAAGLSLTSIYSRRGPLIYPVYAAILATLALLATRYPSLPFIVRFVASLCAFVVASIGLSITVDILAAKGRRRLVAQGRLPATALNFRPSLAQYLLRAAFLVAVGSVVSAGTAFIAS